MTMGYLSAINASTAPPLSSEQPPPPPPFGTFSGAPAPELPPAGPPPPLQSVDVNSLPAAPGSAEASFQPPPPPPAQSVPPPPAAGPAPSPFLQRVHGAMNVSAPAREVEMRGPQLKAAQGERNHAFEGAIAAVHERSQETAAQDYALALEEQRKAGIREDAANYSAAERANELADRQADFDTSTKALTAQSIDPGRFWSNANVGVKLAALIGVALGGFVQGKRGGSNVGMDSVKMMMDADIKAQEFAYNASRDTVNAKQTAFSMAMQKYNNVDAARASARAAALDAAVGVANQKAALWKGTEAGNRAALAAAEMSQDRANQIQAGVAFVPAKTMQVGAQYRDPRTGLTYSEAEAKGIVAKMDEREEKRDEQGRTVAGQVIVEGVKAGAKAGEKGDESQRRWVPTSSTGTGYYAPTEKEGVEHREQQAATQEVIDLVAQLKKDSAELGVTGRGASNLPGGMGATAKRMETTQRSLVGAVNRAQKFGALDKGALDLVNGMTGDALSLRGADANLDALAGMAHEKRRQLERSATGEKPPTMPKSFQAHGAK